MLNIKKRATAVALLALLAGSPTTTPFLYSSVLAEKKLKQTKQFLQLLKKSLQSYQTVLFLVFRLVMSLKMVLLMNGKKVQGT